MPKKGKKTGDRYEPLLDNEYAGPSTQETPRQRRVTSTTSVASVASDVDVIQETLGRLEDTLVALNQRVEHIHHTNPHTHDELLEPIKKHKIPEYIVNNMLLTSFIWQILNVALLMATNRNEHNTGVDVSLFIMMFFQGANIALVSILSVKLVKQVMHTTISIWFLVQSYLSTVLLFAGVYMLIHRVNPAAFVSVFSKDHENGDAAEPWLQFIQMVYFSTATQTTVGYGDLHPRVWYTYLLTCVQMLVSVMYSTAIFSLGLAHFTDRKRIKAARERMEAHAIQQAGGGGGLNTSINNDQSPGRGLDEEDARNRRIHSSLPDVI